MLARYDDPRTLFYLDPPYDQTEGYGIDFGRSDYVAMAEQLATIRGQFILSINATDFIRETFAAFAIEEIATTWTLGARNVATQQRVTELIICNR
ncbi:site-specific DNA-adenine methylase [Sphingomonas jejuensis]|uniref:Site-specific DNA-adenine methylase n=1 Tax=Sphingomonas jejuensis TaxID=904715 RepID=A0ABX0XM65_9SPHN|nr:site-specific DNA-adenine methylase [Sphingomonas jejuensis]